MSRDPKPYVPVTKKFVDRRLTVDEFVDTYMERWKKDTDAEHERKTPRERRAENKLLKQVDSGAISGEQFSDLWRELHGWDKSFDPMFDAIDALFTASDCYCNDPELFDLSKGDITEAQLRIEAEDALKIFRSFDH